MLRQSRTRGCGLLETGPPPDAEAELRALLDQAPNDPVLRSSLGFRLAVWGGGEQSDEALALFEALAEEEPDSPEVLANIGWGLYRMGRPIEAAAALEAALEVRPGSLLDRVRLGVVLGELGDTEQGGRSPW